MFSLLGMATPQRIVSIPRGAPPPVQLTALHSQATKGDDDEARGGRPSAGRRSPPRVLQALARRRRSRGRSLAFPRGRGERSSNPPPAPNRQRRPAPGTTSRQRGRRRCDTDGALVHAGVLRQGKEQAAHLGMRPRQWVPAPRLPVPLRRTSTLAPLITGLATARPSALLPVVFRTQLVRGPLPQFRWRELQQLSAVVGHGLHSSLAGLPRGLLNIRDKSLSGQR